VRRVAADHRAQADDAVVPLLRGQFPRQHGQLPRARGLDDLDVGVLAAGARQRVERARQQAVGNQAVEAGDQDGELQPLRIQIPFDHVLRHNQSP
jgi:hypothetical protein